MSPKKTNIDSTVTIRFSGDSGDGMQLTGNQFTSNTAIFGNDLATLPDFPAEIRAPQGSLFGVSSFQLQFGSKEIFTPGDDLDVLVAMNPAGLKVHLCELKENGILIINTNNFTPKNINLAKWESNPLDDSKILNKYRTEINGIVHCSGGGQTKILHFIDNMHIIKDNMFDLPLLFELIQKESGADWKEMYKVFNMGHRMELYIPEEIADDIIAISRSFNVDAKLIGRVERFEGKKLTISSKFGTYIY